MNQSEKPDMAYLDTESKLDFEILGHSEAIAALFGAMAMARAEFGSITKNRHVDVRKDGKPLYGFDYADLQELHEKTVPALSKHGLSVMQPPTTQHVRTILAHKGGALIVSKMELPKSPDIKTFGGHITFLRRYAYAATLSICADADADDMPEEKRGEGEVSGYARQPQRREAPAARSFESGTTAQNTATASTGAGDARPATWVTGTMSHTASSATTDPAPITDEQRAQIRELLKSCGATNAIQTSALVKELLGVTLDAVNAENAKSLIIKLGQRAIKTKEADNA